MKILPIPLRHHAYFIDESAFGISLTQKELETYVRDMYTYESLAYDTLSIDDVRNIRSEITLSSPDPKKDHVYILDCFSIGHDAQHALLKLLEEPRRGVHFIFLIFSTKILLPTLLSRIEIVRPTSSKAHLPEIYTPKPSTLEFLSQKTSERLSYLEKSILKVKPSDPKSLPKKRLLLFLDDLERNTILNFSENKEKNSLLLEEYSFIRENLLSPGASPKILGEYLCFLV